MLLVLQVSSSTARYLPSTLAMTGACQTHELYHSLEFAEVEGFNKQLKLQPNKQPNIIPSGPYVPRSSMHTLSTSPLKLTVSHTMSGHMPCNLQVAGLG